MAELVGGAVVGAIFGELLKAVLEMKDKVIGFKQILSNLQSTLEAIAPVIKEIEQHNNDLGRRKEELERLIRQMEDGTKLVSKCSKIHRLNYLARIRYQEQLLELLIYLKFIEMQTQTARDQKETLLTVRRILSKVNKLPYGSSEDTRRSDSDLDVSDSESFYSAETQLSENAAGFSRTKSTEQLLEDITSLTLTQEGSQDMENLSSRGGTRRRLLSSVRNEKFSTHKSTSLQESKLKTSPTSTFLRVTSRGTGTPNKNRPYTKPHIQHQSEANAENNQATEHLMNEESYDQLFTSEKRFLSIYLPKIKPIVHNIGGNIIALKGCPYNFDLEDIMRASTEVFEKGVYGTTYKAILKAGTTLLVKRLEEVHLGKKEFELQVEIMQRLSQHPNVMPLLAYYYSKPDILLIYDYKAANSFSSLLHGTRETGRTPLKWDSRLKIALGAARGIAHIHSQSHKKIVHGNITSSNVLVTSDLQGCIFDFGLTSLAHFSGPSGNEGCKNLTHKSDDVHSFGILLFEMLTGTDNDPVGHCFAHEVSVEYDMLFGRGFYDGMLDDEVREATGNRYAMEQILQLAMACVEENSPRTPSMEEIVRIIERIPASRYSTKPCTSQRVVIVDKKQCVL